MSLAQRGIAPVVWRPVQDFFDCLRNQRGAITVAAYEVRARPGLLVSVPINYDERKKIAGADQRNIHNHNLH